MRVALFGGSFDPPHRGHVALARLAKDRLRLDRILVAPVGKQPFKQDATSAGFEDRVAISWTPPARMGDLTTPSMPCWS
jgi:nicotinate-nucleotide adenylyltransferase